MFINRWCLLQVQVIQPMGAAGGQFVSQQYVQQQLMLQNATGIQSESTLKLQHYFSSVKVAVLGSTSYTVS